MVRKFDLQDELHDIRALGGIRNYLITLYQIKRGNWQWHRIEAQKKRAARKERRLMKTSTFDALTENMGLDALDENERGPYDWSQSDLEGVLADTIAVERRRWLERAQWIVLLLVFAGFGYLTGWHMQPQYAPDPVKCTVVVHGVGKEASVVKCEGVPE